jgi:hypothetical protein
MARTTVGLFDTFAQAQQAVNDLTNSGVRRDDISIVANDMRGEYSREIGGESKAAEGAVGGALGGGVLGGVLGLLVGIGALAIPGIGPVLAAGPLAAALGAAGATAVAGAGIGAASGGIIGALVGAGIPEEEAHVYAEGVRRGGVLVTAVTDDAIAGTAQSIMRRNGAADVRARGEEWRRSGWNSFDPNAEPYHDHYDESSKIGTATGTVAGAATGAAIGSAGGPVGTVIGGVAGAATGAGLGAAGDTAGERAEDELDDEERRRRTR